MCLNILLPEVLNSQFFPVSSSLIQSGFPNSVIDHINHVAYFESFSGNLVKVDLDTFSYNPATDVLSVAGIVSDPNCHIAICGRPSFHNVAGLDRICASHEDSGAARSWENIEGNPISRLFLAPMLSPLMASEPDNRVCSGTSKDGNQSHASRLYSQRESVLLRRNGLGASCRYGSPVGPSFRPL